MKDINMAVITGRLTRDSEFASTPDGKSCLRFSVAVNFPHTDPDNTREDTSFFDIVVWGGQAEWLRPRLLKSTRVIVAGRLRQDRWQDKLTGENRSKVEIVGSNVQIQPPATKGETE